MLVLYKALKFFFRHLLLPRHRYPAARFFARLVFQLNTARRLVITQNLEGLIGERRAKDIAPLLLENFAMTSVDFFCPRLSVLKTIREENSAVVQESLDHSKRVVIATAHLGNWELGMSYLIHKGFELTGLYAPYRENDVVEWIMSHRNSSVEWISAERGAAVACVNALERGRLLAIVADIPFGERGRRVKIGSRWARLPLGPWVIAARAKAVVIPGFVLREKPGHYKVIFDDPIEPVAGTFREQIVRMQELYRKRLEATLLKYPEQWGVLQPFWEPS